MTMRLAFLMVATFLGAASACSSSGNVRDNAPPKTAGDKDTATMKLTSSAFEANGSMDPRFTCEGADVSPPLAWSQVPEGTKSFALVVDDPDAPDPAAPKRVWVHWVVYDIPATVTQLAEGAATALPAGAKIGTNDWKKQAYGGPCPPIGRHRYFHKIYALDTTLDLDAPDKKALEAAMEGHILGRGELVGTYQKRGS